MAALTVGKNRPPERFRHFECNLKSGEVAYQGGMAFLDLGELVVATAATGKFGVGLFLRDYSAVGGAKKVTVDLGREVTAYWFGNASGGDAATATNVGDLVYFVNDNDVSPVATGRSLAGRCWGFDATTNRLLVERLDPMTA